MKMTQLTKDEITVLLACIKTLKDNMGDMEPPECMTNIHEVTAALEEKLNNCPLFALELEGGEKERAEAIMNQKGFAA